MRTKTRVSLILTFLLLASSFTVTSRGIAIINVSEPPTPVGVLVSMSPNGSVRYVNSSDYFYVRPGFLVGNWSILPADVQNAFLNPQQNNFTLQTNAPNFENPPMTQITEYHADYPGPPYEDAMLSVFFFQFHPGDLAPGTYTFTGTWSATALANPPSYEPIYYQNTITLVVLSGPARDIAIVDIVPSQSIVASGYVLYVNVTVENRGNQEEKIYVGFRVNDSHSIIEVGSQDLTIPPDQNRTATIPWYTSGFEGVYALGAYVPVLSGEQNVSNNWLEGGQVTVNSRTASVIIVAGNDYGDKLSQINDGCNQVYMILRSVGFSADSIYYLNQPEYSIQYLDGDGLNDIDDVATSSNLQWAIAFWAQTRADAAHPLFLYLFDHGDADYFCIDSPDTVTSSQLTTWLNWFEDATGAHAHVIYAACSSGSFINELSKTGRVVATSCLADETSHLGPDNKWEFFSEVFWPQIKSGHSVGESFNYAYDELSAWSHILPTGLVPLQTPLLDDNGDGVGHGARLGGDGNLAKNIYIGACEWPFPWISYVIPRLVTRWPPTSAITLWAKVENMSSLVHVRAWMVPPDWSPPVSEDKLVSLNLEYFEMSDTDYDGNWTLSIPTIEFTEHSSGPGNFTFFITADEEGGSMAIPAVTSIQFTETGQPYADTFSPTVNIERPLTGLSVYGTIFINGTASDDNCLRKVELYVDGKLTETDNLQPASTSFFEMSFDTTATQNGPINMAVKVFDTSGNSGEQTATYIINNYVHDVAVTDVEADSRILEEAPVLHLNVTLANHGVYPESFNLNVYLNETSKTQQLFDLPVGNCTTRFLLLNGTGLSYGNYTLRVEAEPVEGENQTADNTYDRWIVVTVQADLDGNGKVNIVDVTIVASAYGSTPKKPNWNPVADLDNNGTVNIVDVTMVAKDFGRTS